ncbi:uncharacterized protein [Musca autumnalis]|uniref:uncharacterized protein n=1 Tax=Musca autumnalis TaxID=221902 RepID=UPI003CEB9031
MAKKPILYGSFTSPAVNAVVMTFKAINVDFEFRDVKPLKGDNASETYLEKNPTGTIPCLETEDNRFIGDSHAITAYIVDRYAPDNSLYPKDLYRRAKIQQLQHFSDSILFTSCVKAAYEPIFWRTKTTVDEEIYKRIDKAYGMMERFLSQHKWVAADHVTIADFHCIVCVYGLFYLKPIEEELYPRLFNWFQRTMNISYVTEMLTSKTMTSSMAFLDKYVAKLSDLIVDTRIQFETPRTKLLCFQEFSLYSTIMVKKPILYGSYTSPGVNAVVMTFKAINADFEFREIKPLKGENASAEYLAKNPTGTIPCLETEDNQFIGDSHAITAYIVDRYARDDSLYPKDLYKRAKVQQLQHFADSFLFTLCVRPAYEPIYWRTKTTIDEEIFRRINKAYEMMERFLSQNKWMAADHITIADFHCFLCSCGLYYLKPIDDALYPRLFDWFQRTMLIPYVMEVLASDIMTSSKNFLDKRVAKL